MSKKGSKGGGRKGDEEEHVRIAIVDGERCKPKKCGHECHRNCPVVRQGKMCIAVEKKSTVAKISEDLCVGCGICVKKCPFDAIKIINLPKSLNSQTTHRYGPNSFKLHRLPMPRPGQVLGLVGINGIGKSTALKILSAKLKPNLGRFEDHVGWDEILAYFRGSELQNYFTKILEEDLKAVVKPQYVDQIPKQVRGEVGAILQARDQRNCKPAIMQFLQLEKLENRDVQVLSGGELQRFALAVVAVQLADVYMFDEPTSYLDVKQRLQAAELIRSMLTAGVDAKGTYVVCVEHDLSVLDYLSDYICVLYGAPGAYGVVTMPFSVREGINIFLAGFVPTENMRFRPDELTFKVSQGSLSTTEETIKENIHHKYPDMHKTLMPRGPVGKGKGKGKGKAGPEEGAGKGKAGPEGAGKGKGESKRQPFRLHVEAGGFRGSQIVVMLGENGTGKTTFIRMLAGLMSSDADDEARRTAMEKARAAGIEFDLEQKFTSVPELTVSYKPQTISPKFPGSVRELIESKCGDAFRHPQFQTDVVRPLNIEDLMDQPVTTLSGACRARAAHLRLGWLASKQATYW